LVVRHFLISAHYRHPLDFSADNLDAAQASVKRLRDCLIDVAQEMALQGDDAGEAALLDDVAAEYDAAMDDDFNTAKALGVLFTLIGKINERRTGGNDVDRQFLRNGLATLRHLCGLLGLELGLENAGGDTDALAALANTLGVSVSNGSDEDAALQAFITHRAEARKRRDFGASDAVRDRLAALGYVLQDTAHGTTWKREN
jgi:cysteinyl-tRNA synthetase